MCSSSLNFSLLLVFIYLSTSITAQSPMCFYSVGNFTNNSAYQAQLDYVVSTIPTTNSLSSYGFLNLSTLTDDSPNVMGLCRGDQRTEACRKCLNNSANYLRQLCPNQKEALVYEENCTLRYTNRSLLGKVETNITIDRGPYVMIYNTQNGSNPDSITQNLRSLLAKLRSEAASSGSQRKFAAGNTRASDYGMIYAYVQCTPDLTEQQCSDCLDVTYSRMDQCCYGKAGGRIMTPSCTFRYELSQFLDPVEPLPSSTSSTTPATLAPPPGISLSPPDSNDNTPTTIILIVVPIIVAVIILIIFVIVFLKMKKKNKLSSYRTISELRDVEYVQYDLAIIEAATSNFSKDNKLGQGGFGAVYKGKLPDGQLIAVKRLSRGSGQGELEFKNEVILLVKLQHKNLVRLQGFCLEGNEKLLIYEFLENSSLDHFIFDANKRESLDWETRYKIITGIARGLLYLHEDSRLRIIHRDLKASNILLDSEMNPKISDFGLAKLFVLNQTEADTSRIVGTYGYMAPEYAMHGNFSIKSDVYSFGVLILEIMSGEKNSSFRKGEYVEHLPNFVWRNWTEGTLSKVIDPTLKSSSKAEMTRCIHIGLLCVQQNVADRPTMDSVVRMLNSDSTALALPSQPACFMHDNTTLHVVSTQEHTYRESNLSNNVLSITEFYPR